MKPIRPESSLPGFEIYSKDKEGKYNKHQPCTSVGTAVKHASESALIPLSEKYIFVKLPSENADVSGIYYFILKKIAWEGINISDLISTMHEFTIIVDDESVDRAFSILKGLNKEL